MPSHFRSYADNLNRLHLADLLDRHAQALRMARMKPSLIANPLTGRPYAPRAPEVANTDAFRHN